MSKERETETQRERELSFVKVSKEGTKQAEVMAEPDPVSSHFGCFLPCSFPSVWDAGMRLSPARFLCVSLLHDENTSL